MPYTTLTPGSTITSSWANANVRDQVVTPFATAAARTSAITSPVEGMVTYRADADVVEFYDGTSWRPMPGQYIGETTTTTGDVTQAAAANQVLISTTFTAVNNARYRIVFETTYKFSVGNGCILTLRHAAGSSVSTASTGVGAREIMPVSTAQHTPISFARSFVAAASGTYTVGVSANFYTGSGSLFWAANAGSEMKLMVEAAA
jgi:hypothetical protein